MQNGREQLPQTASNNISIGIAQKRKNNNAGDDGNDDRNDDDNNIITYYNRNFLWSYKKAQQHIKLRAMSCLGIPHLFKKKSISDSTQSRLQRMPYLFKATNQI